MKKKKKFRKYGIKNFAKRTMKELGVRSYEFGVKKLRIQKLRS